MVKDIDTKKGHSRSDIELATRHKIANIFLTVPDENMYAEVLKIILEVMESKYGVFGYIDENGALIVPSMTRGVWWEQCNVPEKDIIFPRETWGNSSWARAIREKKTNYTNESSSLTPKGHILISRHISMPIIYQNEVIGLLQVANRDIDYQKGDILLLESLGAQIAPILAARLQRDRQEKQRKKAEDELKQHKDNLEKIVEERTRELARQSDIIQQQARDILDVSTPVLQVWQGVVVAPLIGSLDSQRTQQFMERLLERIVETNSSVALVDITGVPTIDTQTAQHLIDTISAVKLLGAQVILTGVRPAIAQTLVHLGIDLSGVATRSSLAAGLLVAMDTLGIKVVTGSRKNLKEA